MKLEYIIPLFYFYFVFYFLFIFLSFFFLLFYYMYFIKYLINKDETSLLPLKKKKKKKYIINRQTYNFIRDFNFKIGP